MTYVFTVQEELEKVEHLSELREDDRLVVFAPVSDGLQQAEDLVDLGRGPLFKA